VKYVWSKHFQSHAVVLDLFLVHLVHIERWIGHHEVELAETVVEVFVIAVPQPNVARHGMHGKVHHAKLASLTDSFLAVARDFHGGFLFVGFNEVSTLGKHATRSAGWIANASVVRLDDLYDQLDQRGWREEFAATLTFRTGEIAQEVFVNLSERVAFGIDGDLGEVL